MVNNEPTFEDLQLLRGISNAPNQCIPYRNTEEFKRRIGRLRVNGYVRVKPYEETVCLLPHGADKIRELDRAAMQTQEQQQREAQQRAEGIAREEAREKREHRRSWLQWGLGLVFGALGFLAGLVAEYYFDIITAAADFVVGFVSRV